MLSDKEIEEWMGDFFKKIQEEADHLWCADLSRRT